MDLTDILTKQKELDDSVQTYGKKAVQRELEKFFEENPQVVSIRWDQYTPYFNDGEPCIFHVHEPHFRTLETDESGDDGDYTHGDDQYFDYLRAAGLDYQDYEWVGEYDKRKRVWKDYVLPDQIEQYERYAKLGELLCSNERALEAAFGDHVVIIADPDEITVEEYYHD